MTPSHQPGRSMQLSFDTPFNVLAMASAGDRPAMVVLTRDTERRIVLSVVRPGLHTPVSRRVLDVSPLHDEIKTIAQQMIIQQGWDFMRWGFVDVAYVMHMAPEKEAADARMLQTFRWNDEGQLVEWRLCVYRDHSDQQYLTHTPVSGGAVKTELGIVYPVPSRGRVTLISSALQEHSIISPQYGAFDLASLVGADKRLQLPSGRRSARLSPAQAESVLGF